MSFQSWKELQGHPNLQGTPDNFHCLVAALDINPGVECISRVFALLVHDLEIQVLILALRCHIILSRYVQGGAKGIKSTHRECIRDIWNLWARFTEIQIKMRFGMRRKIVDASNHPNKVT